jgi:ATP-dependent Clp protease ATP-binding subunit ClpB
VIFMTSNLGAAEMGTILRPNLGFAVSDIEQRHQSGHLDESVAAKMSRAGVEASRRKFTPEFMNRIDKLIVFKPLGQAELQKILTLELNALQQRIYNSSPNMAFVFSTTESAIDYLLREGTDIKYGARHLKRAIDRALVHPMSNLIATRQVHSGDLIKVDYDSGANQLTFAREGEDIPAYAMAQMMGAPAGPIGRLSARASVETPTLAARRRILAG